MTPAETRDATLRTVQLPDCCGNCIFWKQSSYACRIERGKTRWVNFDQRCKKHERKPDGGNGNETH